MMVPKEKAMVENAAGCDSLHRDAALLLQSALRFLIV